MPEMQQHQMVFAGVDPSTVPHLLDEQDVQTATNVDFSLEPGCAQPRRGSTSRGTLDGTTPITYLYRHYWNPNDIANSPLYCYGSSGNVWMLGTATTGTLVNTGSGSPGMVGMGAYSQYTYMSINSGAQFAKVGPANGTGALTRYAWAKPTSAAPTVVLSTLTPLAISATWTVVEGSMSANGTATTGTGNRLVLTSVQSPANLNSNGGVAIDEYGVDTMVIAFSEPKAVTKVVRDYSIGDSTFQNYFHTEYNVETNYGEASTPDGMALIDANTSGDLGAVEEAFAAANLAERPSNSIISLAPNAPNKWAIPRTDFVMIGTYQNASGVSPWANIGAVRVIVETEAQSVVTISSWSIEGGTTYPLNDTDVGYTYYITWANIFNNIIVSEGPPSTGSARVKCARSRAAVTGPTPPAGHDITHAIFYRQGGFLRDAYAVGTVATTTSAPVLTDTLSDVQVLMRNERMLTRGVRASGEWPTNIVTVSEPHYARLFLAESNRVHWTLPNKPDALPWDSYTEVSHAGDQVQALVPWAPSLAIVNRDSVYELHGDLFEGNEANWALVRTGSRHGSKAKKVCIRTPYGIPMLDWDGLHMYMPGQGVDTPVDWFNRKVGDAFREGASGTGRVPWLALGYIDHASAAYVDGKLYLACTTESDTTPRTVFVLDFAAQRVWWYRYPFPIYSLLWDQFRNQLLAGSTGKVYVLEYGGTDSGTSIAWKVKTRAWTVPTDTRLNNLSVEYRGRGGTANVILDGTTTTSVGTFTNLLLDWLTPPLNAVIANNVVFEFGGTSTGDVQLRQVQWDALAEPKRVRFLRTDYDTVGYPGEKMWDVHFADLELVYEGTGTPTVTVYGTCFVDNVAVMTATYQASPNGRQVWPTSYPIDTYGDVGYVIYSTPTADAYFKLWENRFSCRNEPPRTSSWKSDVESLDENWIEAYDVDINPNGTAISVCYVDNVPVGTNTLVGWNRQSHTFAVPTEVYGRTLFVTYNGNAFKHYNTWFHKREEPDRWTSAQSVKFPFPSNQQLRTWDAELHPYGTATGTLYADNTVLMTATFVGNYRQHFTVGLDVDSSLVPKDAQTLWANYNMPNKGKHYSTNFETTAKPYGKKTWAIRYNKLGGATQVDLARYFSMDVEPVTGTATVTSIWDADGTAVSTYVGTYTTREWRDRIPFPPGVRGYLFQQRVYSATPIQIHRSNIDLLQVGVKGLSRRSVPGTPE